MNIRNQQTGFSLIEMLLALGVIALILLAAFVVYPQVREDMRVNRARENILAATASLSQAFPASLRRTGASGTIYMSQATARNLLPKDWISTTGPSLVNEWGGQITIGIFGKGYAADGTLFQIVYRNVPAAACADLALFISSERVFRRATMFTSSGSAVLKDTESSFSSNPYGSSSVEQIVSACEGGAATFDLRWR